MIVVQHLSSSVSTCTPLVQTLEKADFGDEPDDMQLSGHKVHIGEVGEVSCSP